MVWMNRRKFLILAGTAAVGSAAGVRWWFPKSLRPGKPRPLSIEALSLINRSFEGIDRARAWDMHAHLLGTEESGNGCWINPKMRSHLYPVLRFQYECYLAASGVDDPERGDEAYVERLLHLHRGANPEGRIVLFAFEIAVDEQGEESREHVLYQVPDRYVLDIAAAHSEFEACASIHPYRKDALERLDLAAEAGTVAVKWIPNAMGMDPASPLCDRFYRRLAELRLPLITHTGREMAVSAMYQHLGNPLRLRRALDHGVRVVAAHCASLGKSADLDRGGERKVPSFELFLRLMGDKQYAETLYGDISAITLINHSDDALREVLAAEEHHHRLVNGSDYPIPAIGAVTSTRLLERSGFITGPERRLCNEIFEHNSLLYDFVLKRCLKVERDGRTFRFPPEVFESARLFEPA